LRYMLGVYADNQEWKRLQMNGMEENFSWHNPAIAYAQLYKRLTEEP
jgi:glycogen synthase